MEEENAESAPLSVDILVEDDTMEIDEEELSTTEKTDGDDGDTHMLDNEESGVVEDRDTDSPRFYSSGASSPSKAAAAAANAIFNFWNKTIRKKSEDEADEDVDTFGTYTRIHLRVRAETKIGEQLRCSGSSVIMGQYNPNESMALVTSPEEYPYWHTLKPLILPRGIAHRYKYALFSGGEFSSWEPIEYDRYLVPEGGEMTVEETYGEYDSSMLLIKKQNDLTSNFYTRVKVDCSSPSAPGDKTSSPEGSPAEDNMTNRTASQHLRQSKLQSGYKRYVPSNYKPDPESTLFLVCYHLPIVLHKDQKTGNWSAQWNRDSLIAKSERNSIANSMSVVWVGCINHQLLANGYAEGESLTAKDEVALTKTLRAMACVPVFINENLARNHYEGYCKSVLWPMFHNVDILDIRSSVWLDNKSFQDNSYDALWEAYSQVNQMIADKVTDVCKPGDVIWAHDYHLLLFPAFVHKMCRIKWKEKVLSKQQSMQKDLKEETTKYDFGTISKNDKEDFDDEDFDDDDDSSRAVCGNLNDDFLDYAKLRPKMVFFLHVPFPTSEIFRELSNGTELLRGVLGVDVVGFHSFDHARHFLNACKRFLGLTYQSRRGGNLGVNYHGRNVVVTISHVGIETDLITDVNDRVKQYFIQNPTCPENLRNKYPGKLLLVGVDACQRLSGVTLKLLAFEQFLASAPIWRNRVVFVQRCWTTLSRHEDQQHSSSEIRQLVLRITSKYGADVIDYEETNSQLSLKQRIELWLSADILMDTSIRGGLNLKPLEFVFVNDGNGCVILSEFSACCCVLNGGLRVNPWNIAEVMNSLDTALTMSVEEKITRRQRDLPYITKQPAGNWTKQVLSVLQEALDREEEDEELTDMEYRDVHLGRSHLLRAGDFTDFRQLNKKKVLRAYKSVTKNRSNGRRLFLLDYGGTIIARENMSMYVKKDFTAVSGRVPSRKMLNSLSQLCQDPLNSIFIVSGVSQVNLTKVLGHIQGLAIATPGDGNRQKESNVEALYTWARSIDSGVCEDEIVKEKNIIMNHNGQSPNQQEEPDDRHWRNYSQQCDWHKVRELADPILKTYSSRTNGSILSFSDYGISWNFRSCDPEWGLMQANSLQSDLEEMLVDLPVDIMRKKGLLEIVPTGQNKGVVVRNILIQDINQHNQTHPDFIICIGDDTADESMFKAIYDYYAERFSNEHLSEPSQVESSNSSTINNQNDSQHIFTCTVGKKPSLAHLFVNEVNDVEDLLYTLGHCSSKQASPSKV